jgi:hypothetical protein
LPIEASDQPSRPGHLRRVLRLLHERGHVAVGVGADHAELSALVERHRDGRDGHLVALLDVEIQHLLDVHLVHVVGAEHADEVGILVGEHVERLVQRVGRAAEPVLAHALLRRHRLDVTLGHGRQVPATREVRVQRIRFVLGEDLDLRDAAVDQVRQDEVDEPVAAADGDGGLGAVRGERQKACALATGEDNCEHARRRTTSRLELHARAHECLSTCWRRGFLAGCYRRSGP